MNIWLIQRAEPLPVDEGQPRLLRTGLLAEALLRRGHHVTWWTSTFNHNFKVDRYPKDTLVRVSDRYRLWLMHGSGYRNNRSLSRIIDQKVLAGKFRKLARTEARPDIIVSSLPSVELCLAAVEYGQREGVPVVIDMRDMWPDIFVDVFPGPLRGLARLGLWPLFRDARKVCRMATAITGITEPFVDWGLRRGRRARTALDRSFPMGYKSRRPDAGSLQEAEKYWEALGVRQDAKELVICFIGAVNSQFDLGTAIRAVRRGLSEGVLLKLIICGIGDRLDHFKRLADGEQNIIFTGFINAPKLHVLLRRSQLGLDPLPDRYDFLATINNKAIEYLSAGLPVISCPQKGVLFDLLKENQCGLSYEHGDAVGLSCLLGQLDRDRKTVAQMSRNAALLFEERFVAEKVYEQMACSIENIASLNHPLKDQDRENDDREPKNKRQSEGGLAPGIVYKRSWPVRMAKSILYISHNVMPQSAYQAMYGFGRRVLWAHQRLAYRIRFLIAKSFCQGETLERLRLVDLLLPFTMGGPLALESTFDIVSKAEKEGIPGALVECGVAKGGCSAMMALTSRYFGARRKLWLFDSYEGLPDPTVDDFKGEKAGEIIGPLAKGMLVGTVEQVKDLMFNKCSVSEDEVHLVKGWFQDTVPGTKDRVGKIAVLRLDGDWYESTKCCLENLYDSVTEGGYLIIDDYGTCFGCKRAVDEFLIKRRLRADLVPDGRGGVWFQKTA